MPGRLTDRKRQLVFTTSATVRYKGKEREIVVEAHPLFVVVRLLGTRTRYEVAWTSIFHVAAEIFMRREREKLRDFLKAGRKRT